jgi:sugar phosphate isomerase/epimerase
VAIDILGPYLAPVDAKNTAWVLKDRPACGPWRWETSHSRMREGITDWKAIMGALQAAGFDGWVSLEGLTDQLAREITRRHPRFPGVPLRLDRGH